MTEQSPEQNPENSPRTSAGALLAIAMFAVGAFWALEVFGLGMMSLLLGRDVITDPRAGVGLGLAMVAGATVALVAGLLRVGFRRAVTVHWTSIFGIAAAVYVAYLATGLLGWVLFSAGVPAAGVLFALGAGGDWPSVVVVVNATIVALSYFGTLSYRSRTPRSI